MPARTTRFGAFEVDAGARVLRKCGLRIKLRRQSFDVLAALLEHAGEVVTRQHLRERLWPETNFGDFESSLNSAVARLRRALRDSAAKPQYIETVPGVGYRFAGRLAEAPSEAGGEALRLLVLPFLRVQDTLLIELLSLRKVPSSHRRMLILRTCSRFHWIRRARKCCSSLNCCPTQRSR